MARLARLSLLLALTAPLSAQAIPFSSLHAKTPDLRFFAGYKTIPDLMTRFYPRTIDSATTQFVYLEIGLDYPAAPTAGDFVLQCTVTGPSGAAATAALNGHVEAGWTGSRSVTDWGSETPGTWQVGDYQAACKDGATVVATGKFTVSRDQFSLPDLHGVVTNMAFFESPLAGGVAHADRKYTFTFNNASTRSIFIELGFDYPKTTAAVQSAVECTYTYPDDRKFNTILTLNVEAGWTGNWISHGIGYEQPGNWMVGTYHVECRYQGRAIAVGGFVVQ